MHSTSRRPKKLRRPSTAYRMPREKPPPPAMPAHSRIPRSPIPGKISPTISSPSTRPSSSTDFRKTPCAGQFASAGIVPVMGAGSVSEEKQPEPLEAGSAVSAILVRGDMDIAATCTVTYIDPQRLLAWGHPLLQFGSVDLPMNKAQVLATLLSPLNAFKIVNTTEQAGVFVQDRHTGIMV